MSAQAKISIETALEISERIEAIKCLTVGLLAALDESGEDSEGDSVFKPKSLKEMSMTGWFITDKKILLSVFANLISEQFRDIEDYVKRQETFRDLN